MKQKPLKIPVSKPRNPLVALATFRKAEFHGKTHKANRRKDKVALKQGRVVFNALNLVH